MSVLDTIDWPAALRTYLLSSSYVTDEVITNGVYVGSIPEGVLPPGKMIVIVPSGGNRANRLPLLVTSVDLRCYGDDSIEAMEVYRGAASALATAKRKKINPGVGVGSGTNWLVVAKEGSLPSYHREPVTEWHFMLANFDCTFVSFPVA